MPRRLHTLKRMPTDLDFSRNIERFTGFAAGYDAHRPSPPAALAPLLIRIARSGAATRVVDLGSGTGLSTRYWAAHAAEVTGIEPAADMRRQAEERTTQANARYLEGFSHRTGLADGVADIVACSQSLHWMEPQPTFAEAARLLRAGGVFASVDYDWPPVTPAWEADAAYDACMKTIRALEPASPSATGLRQWAKDGHLRRIEDSGLFRYVREITMHHTDTGDAGRLAGLLLSQGSVQTLLKEGRTEAELGIDRLRDIAGRTLGATPATWLWSSRVRLGIK